MLFSINVNFFSDENQMIEIDNRVSSWNKYTNDIVTSFWDWKQNGNKRRSVSSPHSNRLKLERNLQYWMIGRQWYWELLDIWSRQLNGSRNREAMMILTLKYSIWLLNIVAKRWKSSWSINTIQRVSKKIHFQC